jgi:hypothetical protein
MWVCRAAVYLSYALVAVSAVWLTVLYESERQEEQGQPGTIRLSEVRVSEGATLRVEGGQLELAGPTTPGHSQMVASIHGPGPHRGTRVLLVALCVSTLVLGVIVIELVKRQPGVGPRRLDPTYTRSAAWRV